MKFFRYCLLIFAILSSVGLLACAGESSGETSISGDRSGDDTVTTSDESFGLDLFDPENQPYFGTSSADSIWNSIHDFKENSISELSDPPHDHIVDKTYFIRPSFKENNCRDLMVEPFGTYGNEITFVVSKDSCKVTFITVNAPQYSCIVSDTVIFLIKEWEDDYGYRQENYYLIQLPEEEVGIENDDYDLDAKLTLIRFFNSRGNVSAEETYENVYGCSKSGSASVTIY